MVIKWVGYQQNITADTSSSRSCIAVSS